MKTSRWIPLLATIFLFGAIAAVAQTGQQSGDSKLSLGVSLSLPNGSFVGFPIQNGTPEDYLNPIPISGYKNLLGIRMYPHMAGDKVAVRLWAMVPKEQLTTDSGTLDPTKVPHEHRLLGDYVIGKEGDSLQIADVSKVGLPALTAKVVRAPFSRDSQKDPCCCGGGTLFCCGSTWTDMCANCAACPVCQGAARSTKSDSKLLPSGDAKVENTGDKKR